MLSESCLLHEGLPQMVSHCISSSSWYGSGFKQDLLTSEDSTFPHLWSTLCYIGSQTKSLIILSPKKSGGTDIVEDMPKTGHHDLEQGVVMSHTALVYEGDSVGLLEHEGCLPLNSNQSSLFSSANNCTWYFWHHHRSTTVTQPLKTMDIFERPNHYLVAPVLSTKAFFLWLVFSTSVYSDGRQTCGRWYLIFCFV
jgi:hypothetical protein